MKLYIFFHQKLIGFEYMNDEMQFKFGTKIFIYFVIHRNYIIYVLRNLTVVYFWFFWYICTVYMQIWWVN